MSQGPDITGAPVNVGDVIEVTIDKVLNEHKGRATIDDFYFIYIEGENLKVGQKLKVFIRELWGGFAKAYVHSR